MEVRRTWTVDDITGLGATTDLLTAAGIFGIGRSHAYELARTGSFPVPLLRIGRRWIVPVAPILQLVNPSANRDQLGQSPWQVLDAA